jgi:hypothetical protein
MKTEVGRNWHQWIHFDKLSCRQVSFSGQEPRDRIPPFLLMRVVKTSLDTFHPLCKAKETFYNSNLTLQFSMVLLRNFKFFTVSIVYWCQ